jgi:replicative DNA helicase
MTTVSPHDLDLERTLLGTLMLSPTAINAVADVLVPSDFYSPLHGAVFSAILVLRDSGLAVDATTVYSALESRGEGGLTSPSALLQLVVDAGVTTSVPQYASAILDKALRRRMINEGLGLAASAANLGMNAEDILESHQATVASMGLSVIDREPDDMTVEEFLARPRNEISPWAVHGLIRKRHKIMIVGGEGAGKSWVLRFVAICAAYGIQPFRHTTIPPIRTLIIDLENPEDALYDSFETMLKQVRKVTPQQESLARLWWRPAGINLRNRVDVAELENVIRTRRPELVCLGPLYAAYENTASDFGWETAAREVQRALKSLMVRYDFGLLIEDHAPQSDDRGKRQMRPYGSSYWRRWPDVGIGMEPIESRQNAFRLTRWRGDRVPTDWPSTIIRGSEISSPWPFVGRWGEDEV